MRMRNCRQCEAFWWNKDGDITDHELERYCESCIDTTEFNPFRDEY